MSLIISVIAFGFIAALLDHKFNRGRLGRLPFWQLGGVFFCVIMVVHMMTGA